MYLIDVDDVSLSFADGGYRRDLLSHVSLKLQSGRSLSLRGPSGSGKSTLLMLIGKQMQPTAGEVRWSSRDLKVRWVYQDNRLVPFLDTIENVMLAPEATLGMRSRQARSLAEAALGSVGLAGFEQRTIQTLSGGERQRVAIARALCAQPDVLLADEPTGELDSASASLIGTLLRRVAIEHGVAVVVATHDAAIWTSTDERARIEDGAVIVDPVTAGPSFDHRAAL